MPRLFLTLLPVLLTLLTTLPAAGQQKDGAVVMPSGNYIIESRDTAEKVSVAGLPFSLKGNGTFVITTTDGTFNGKITQEKGVVTYTDQGCSDLGSYTAKRERGGYAFDVKTDPCEGRKDILTKWLFVPKK